jgi:hypothetical protein
MALRKLLILRSRGAAVSKDAQREDVDHGGLLPGRVRLDGCR